MSRKKRPTMTVTPDPAVAICSVLTPTTSADYERWFHELGAKLVNGYSTRRHESSFGLLETAIFQRRGIVVNLTESRSWEWRFNTLKTLLGDGRSAAAGRGYSDEQYAKVKAVLDRDPCIKTKKLQDLSGVQRAAVLKIAKMIRANKVPGSGNPEPIG